jgi:hypothetical protein
MYKPGLPLLYDIGHFYNYDHDDKNNLLTLNIVSNTRLTLNLQLCQIKTLSSQIKTLSSQIKTLSSQIKHLKINDN